MKISESWLREWINPGLTTQALADQMTMAGLEVGALEPVIANFSGVVVGEILSVEPHPNADKLRICRVAGQGAEPVQVVCGAPNARAGIKIPFAVVGAVLPGEFNIQQARLRGVESAGMLCSQAELQLGDDADGLWELAADAPVGSPLEHYLQLHDTCISVDLTPNRGDCLSVKGLARDIGALNQLDMTPPEITPVTATIADQITVALNAPDACPRYSGRLIRGIELAKPTPPWMRERLRRAGIGCRDIAVDTTNYVLLELGQPLHAFDLARLSGGITVRHGRPHEALTLLNDQTVTLNTETLVIADDEKALAIAGIMGGAHTAVNESTRDILLESAFFVPTAITGRARHYGLHTDSSHRFERGVDYRLQEQALERATQLILEVAGGAAGPVTVATTEHPLLAERKVNLRRDGIVSGLGCAIPDEEVLTILTRLGLQLTEQTEAGWTFTVPSHRFDIAIEADLLEELARIYGYNRLPTTPLSAAINLPPHRETALSAETIKAHLVARDYQEVVCYSFVDAKIQQLLDPEAKPIALKNPISADMAVMRTSLWQSLLPTLQYNIKRQRGRIRLFEVGLRFTPAADDQRDACSDMDFSGMNVSGIDVPGILPGIKQETVIAGLIYGPVQAETWHGAMESVDFYDSKGDVESLLALVGGQPFTFRVSRHPALHPGQTAAILKNGVTVGYLGALHPQVQQTLALEQTAFLFEITQAALAETQLPRFTPLSRFPAVRRDLALVVDRELPVAELLATINTIAGDLLTNLMVFDIYTGEGIDFHRKSVALGLTFQHLSRTLTDDEITAVVDTVIAALQQTFAAELR